MQTVVMQTVSIEELLRQTPKLSALPMHQVWAGCVFLGKNIENRKRPIYRRSTILVYACVDRKGLKESLRIISKRPALRSVLRAGLPMTFGALLGAVDILILWNAPIIRTQMRGSELGECRDRSIGT